MLMKYVKNKIINKNINGMWNKTWTKKLIKIQNKKILLNYLQILIKKI